MQSGIKTMDCPCLWGKCVVWLSLLCIVLLCFGNQSSWGQEAEQQEASITGTQSLQEKRIASLLKQNLQDLKKREKKLQAREQELKVLRNGVDKKLERMQKIRKSLQEFLREKKDLRQERVKELSGIYENMDPARAAQAMMAMKRDLAIGILSNMRKKLAGEVLNQMPGDKAADLSRDFSNMGFGGEPP